MCVVNNGGGTCFVREENASETLLWQHILELFVAERDLMDWIPAVLERDVVAVDVGWEKDLWTGLIEVHTTKQSDPKKKRRTRVPSKSLTRREVGDLRSSEGQY